jgi:glycosyltransferase involved in cell wall biosynthesis
MKSALVYDRINKIGGAERVLEVLHSMYPRSPLYTAVYHDEKASWAKGWKIKPSLLNNFPLARSKHELFPWLTPLAFENFNFNEYQVVISITSAEAKGIITKPDTLHICYCLTPTRYLWSDYKTYINEIPPLFRILIKPVFSYLRFWDRIASTRADNIIAISETVRTRIQKYYNRDSQVIYPPVEVDKFADKSKTKKRLPIKNYYLVISRLVPYKRIDIAIKACNHLKKKLVIVGKGSQMKKLRSIAGSTINFVGELTQDELVLYYQYCDALLFPQEEDFGISAVEAQAAGKPVVAYNKGGATEIVKEGKTGTFFLEQNTSSLIKAIKRIETLKFDKKECIENAQRFNKERFIKEFSAKVEELWISYKKSHL